MGRRRLDLDRWDVGAWAVRACLKGSDMMCDGGMLQGIARLPCLDIDIDNVLTTPQQHMHTQNPEGSSAMAAAAASGCYGRARTTTSTK